MTTGDYYATGRQFRRMLALDWSLHAWDFVYGTFYALIGFFVFRRVGYSQVYDVIFPFFLVSALKLGGAGFTSHYRIHPEMVVLPLVALVSTMAHVYMIRDRSYWAKAALLFIVACAWFVWKLNLMDDYPPHSSNNYWPEREMAFGAQLCIAGILLGGVCCLIEKVRKNWQRRQIGGIR